MNINLNMISKCNSRMQR